MSKIFSNTLIFTLLYFAVLLLDILVKISVVEFLSRYIIKPLIVILLIVFYLINFKDKRDNNFYYIMIALGAFLIGDIVLIDTYSGFMYIIGMLLFTIGKLFYAMRFSNTRDFKISRLVPFLIVCFGYTLWIMNLIYDNLGDFFIPTLIYLFITILLLLLSFLRKNDVNDLSYYLVFVGVLFSVVYDSITAISSFYNPDLPYQEITIMLFYGISQYFIVLGIVKEVKVEDSLSIAENV